MRTWLAALFAATLLFWSAAANSQPEPEPPVEEAPAEAAPAAEVLGIGQGEPAPFTGILLTEERAIAYAKLNIDNEELRGKLEVRERLISDLQDQLTVARDINEPGWWERNDFLVGFVLGAVATGVLVWGAVEVLRAK